MTRNAFYFLLLFSAALYGQGDSMPPNLVSFQMVTPQVKGGPSPGTAILRLTVTDDLSGVVGAMATFVSPSKGAQFTLNFPSGSLIQGSTLSGVLEGRNTIPPFAELGTWKILTVSVYDKAGNSNYWRDLSLSFEVIASDPQPAVGQMTSMPQIAFGGDWETTLYFWNSRVTRATAEVELLDDSGIPLPFPSSAPSTSKLSVPIAGASAASLKLPRGGPLQQGWLLSVFPEGVRGYAVFRQIVTGREEKEAAVPFDGNMSSAYAFVCDETEGLVTALSLANPNAVSLSITLQARDEGGFILGTKTISLPPKAKHAFVLTGLNTTGKRYTLTATASNYLFSALGLRFTPAGSFTSIPAL